MIRKIAILLLLFLNTYVDMTLALMVLKYIVISTYLHGSWKIFQ